VPEPLTADPRGGVASLVVRLGFASLRGLRTELEPLGLEPRQYAVLRRVGEAEGRSQQALSDALSIGGSRVVALVDALEEKGLVERRPNPADRRARALHLTPEGRATLAAATERAGDHDRRFTAALSGEERAQLAALLEKLAGAP
jgi:DNA-binding MarR family transcriptional regulator